MSTQERKDAYRDSRLHIHECQAKPRSWIVETLNGIELHHGEVAVLLLCDPDTGGDGSVDVAVFHGPRAKHNAQDYYNFLANLNGFSRKEFQ